MTPGGTCTTVTCIALLLAATPRVQGGYCWSTVGRSGKCTELFSEKSSREQCCHSEAGAATAWSPDEYDAGTLFFWRILGGGVACQPCRETCLGVDCGEGRRCVVRKGRPKCVCSPDCRGGANRNKGLARGSGGGGSGPVCGTDGRTYRTLCRLKKRVCRKRASTLAVAYHGHCQKPLFENGTKPGRVEGSGYGVKISGDLLVPAAHAGSCDRIDCPAGKQCLLDQNLSPHCVRCGARRCPGGGKPVCGVDGVTYQSACHLREAACHKGRAIPVAYRGRCKAQATCQTIHCRDRQSCLVEVSTLRPRCVTCSLRCSPTAPYNSSSPRRLTTQQQPLCGTNNRTYQSWCHMIKEACATGFVIETKFPGTCELKGLSSQENAVLSDKQPSDIS